ncbi:MAG: SGNH/GDSL hydrolase family protein [Pseudonocardiaceae bacterium]
MTVRDGPGTIRERIIKHWGFGMPGRRRFNVVALATLLALLGAASAAAAQPTTGAGASTVTHKSSLADTLRGTGHYVALGDSFAAGPFIPMQRDDPLGCARSTRNYPALVATGLGVGQYVDVTCSAATTVDMTIAQKIPLGSNAPQFDALRADTNLVTVSISGNDIGFGDMALTCGRLSFTDPLGNPCQRQATAGGSDVYAERIIAAAPRVAKVLQGVRERSPHATVLLVGYLRMLPQTGWCWPVVPVSRGDVPYLNGIEQQLTKMLATQAKENGATFVDVYGASMGHDSCQPPAEKWVEGLVPTAPAFPWHPNENGMRAVADLTLSTIRSLPAD